LVVGSFCAYLSGFMFRVYDPIQIHSGCPGRDSPSTSWYHCSTRMQGLLWVVQLRKGLVLQQWLLKQLLLMFLYSSYIKYNHIHICRCKYMLWFINFKYQNNNEIREFDENRQQIKNIGLQVWNYSTSFSSRWISLFHYCYYIYSPPLSAQWYDLWLTLYLKFIRYSKNLVTYIIFKLIILDEGPFNVCVFGSGSLIIDLIK